MSSSGLHQQLTHSTAYPSALPPPLPSALDDLVDRLNASSGSSSTAHHSHAHAGGQSTPSQTAAAAAAPPPPIRAVLIGTNEGAPLHRSYGARLNPNNDGRGHGHGHGHGLSEEILSTLESLYATLPSSAPPHVMAAAQAADAASLAASSLPPATVSSDRNKLFGGVVNESQPPHPLLTPLRMGEEVRVVTVFYDHMTLLQLHMSPLVVTILATPTANIGAVRGVALPLLQELLNPLRRSILVKRREVLMGTVGSVGGVGSERGGARIGVGGEAVADAMEEAFAAGFRAGSFPRGGVVAGGGGGQSGGGVAPTSAAGFYSR